ncbi:MAG: hypothetical protein QUS08_05565 [Methanothrix sp.]|nr:hypothetical protein [Methanothrix sp.]
MLFYSIPGLRKDQNERILSKKENSTEEGHLKKKAKGWVEVVDISIVEEQRGYPFGGRGGVFGAFDLC